MPSIVIRLDPRLLENPDLDLRYDIPDLLVKRMDGAISDAGYDYEIEGEVTGDEAMQIYLATADPARVVARVVEILKSARLHGNELLTAITIGTSDQPPETAGVFQVVYPPGRDGVIHAPRHERA